MKRLLVCLLCVSALALPLNALACTATGFVRDGINMTAAVINPGNVAGTVTTPTVVDATGCNIGVYFSTSGSIQYVDIYGANYFGVVVNGDGSLINVDVKDSTIHNIGETPFNGSQHGVAIYYRAYGGVGTGVTGDIDGNAISLYQKGGIVVNGPNAWVNTLGNTVTGLGKVDFIAQNGIQYWGSNGTIRGNTISDNFYTGTVGVGPNPGGQNPPGWEYIAGGLLLYQTGLVKHSKNFYANNQRNVEMVQ